MAHPRLNQRYRVVRRLGQGADGAVFLVEDEANRGARRALKVVSGLDPAVRDRVAGEFRRLAELEHPRLVRVYDLETVTTTVPGFAPGTVFFTSDFVDGVEPASMLADAPDRVASLLAIAGWPTCTRPDCSTAT